MLSAEINNDVQLAAAFRGEEKAARSAMNVLWKNHYKPLVFFANQLIRNDLMAEDIASETFTKFWQLRQNFDNMPGIRAFLYVTTRNACYDHLRSQEIHARIHKDILYTSDQVAEMKKDDFDMMYAEYMQQLYVQLKELPEACRKIFDMYFFNRFTTREIAMELGLSEQTVRNQKTKAISMLRSALLKKNILPASVISLFFTLLLGGED